MKQIFTVLFSFSFALFTISCNTDANSNKQTDDLTIAGTVEGAGGLNVYLDRVAIGKAMQVLGNTNADANGNFSFEFSEEPLEPGIYRVRIGSAKATLVLDGTEDKVNISGKLASFPVYEYNISGSKNSEEYRDLMQGIRTSKVKRKEVPEKVKALSSPLTAMFVAYQAIGPVGESLKVHQQIQEQMNADYPNLDYAADYSAYIKKVEQAYAQKMASEKIKVGEVAPNITLPSPSGKEYSLEDLRGKIVLLDFWASWCGPCRKENPSVVKVYNKYKNDGFTVFSVSLDGLDTRTRSRYKTPEQLNQAISASKDRWKQAIKQDDLPWEYHVSDLKKWESKPARTYGVRSIPRTFLIDQDGKIAAVGLRGAASIEAEVKKLLNKG